MDGIQENYRQFIDRCVQISVYLLDKDAPSLACSRVTELAEKARRLIKSSVEYKCSLPRLESRLQEFEDSLSRICVEQHVPKELPNIGIQILDFLATEDEILRQAMQNLKKDAIIMDQLKLAVAERSALLSSPEDSDQWRQALIRTTRQISRLQEALSQCSSDYSHMTE